MSAVKFEQPLYKVFEPAYHPQRPIIVDEAIESPETVTLRYEEEAARANGGDLRGESPTGLLPMSTYKPQPTQLHGFADSPFSQYPTQSYTAQQTENAASQMNQMAFAANNAADQYLSSGAAPPTPTSVVNVLSCQPTAGVCGTKVLFKISSQYDLLAMANPAPFAWIIFGAQKCPAQILKDVGDSSYTYSISGDVPQFLTTNCASPDNVPLTLVLEGTGGEELVRVDSAGVFTYHDTQGGGSGDIGPHENLGTRKNPKSPGHRGSPPQGGHGTGLQVRADPTSPSNTGDQGLPADSTATNTYGYPPTVAAAVAAQAQAQSNFAAAAAYHQGSDNMLGAYRTTSSFTDHYSRGPSTLRSPHGGWAAYSAHIARSPVTSIAHSSHTTIARPSLTPLPQPSATPQLIRTSTLQQPSGGGPGVSGYSPYNLFPNKAQLKINGDLDAMSNGWSDEEWDNRRRIVLFRKSQQGSQLTTTFRPVSVNERPPNSICISCIWWAEKGECFVTSVDTIHLLEQLVAAPARFTVEEKNRIRRNLEGFHPLTVSKAKADSEEFFKVIMSFGNPKPRNIEKDVKVFPWKILGQALKKIISKYSASPSSTLPPTTPTHLLTPVSLSGSYPALPPTPGSATTATDPVTATGYVGAAHHVGAAESPRSLSGPVASSSWTAAYPSASSRTLSPGLKTSSPQSGLRISTLQGSYDTRTTGQPITSPYGLPTSTHHSPHHATHATSYGQSVPVSQSHSTRSWDSYGAVTDNYAPQTAAAGHGHTHSHGHGHGSVYGSTGGYGDGTQRA